MQIPTLPSELTARVERFDHLALAVHDIAAVVPLMALLGATYHNGGRHPTDGFRWVQFRLPAGPKIELLSPIEPDDGEHFLSRFLQSNGEGPHHITLKVADIRTAIDAMRDAGYDVVAENVASDGWKEAFVHPKSAHGLLIQLAQWNDDASPSPRTLEEVLNDEVS